MPLSRHSVGTYLETSSHAPCHGTFGHSRLSSLSPRGLILALKKVEFMQVSVSRCGLVVRRLAGKQKDLRSIRFGSPFSSLQKVWFMDTVL